MQNHLPYEKDFQKVVLKKLRLIPGSWWSKWNDRVAIGVPDIIGSCGGCFVALELKTRSKVTKLQAHILKKIGETGAHVFVVTPDNWDMVYSHLLELSQNLGENPQKP